MRRREFLSTTAAVALTSTVRAEPPASAELKIAELKGVTRDSAPTPLVNGTWYVAQADDDGLVYAVEPGAFTKAQYLTTDMLLDGDTLAVFDLLLHESGTGRTFRYTFGGLNQCSFRVRMPFAALNQNRWMMDREGAFLKPMASGDRVDAAKVDRVSLLVRRKGPAPVRWAMTPLAAAQNEVAKLTTPVLPKGALLDEFGQSRQREWSQKTRSAGELTANLRRQYDTAAAQQWPEQFSRWGGYKPRKLADAAGFFRTQNKDGRWWLVDPDGYAFWSTGLDCVRVDTTARYDGIERALSWAPDPRGEFAAVYGSPAELERMSGKMINYLAANMIRAFGKDKWRERWARIALAEMKRLRFNTVGNWSDWHVASTAKFPYVRPLSFHAGRCGLIYRDFPDVYAAGFEQDAADYANQLRATASDPALIGYFLMNEPTWGFSSETPAAGMLFTTETCAARAQLARFLKNKYSSAAALGSAWERPGLTLERVAASKWTGVLNATAQQELRAFSTELVKRYFSVLSRECRRADTNHLNLGMRWAGIPPDWAVEGMKFFDVFSLNCYRQSLPRDISAKIASELRIPVMVGEYHFGALDVGLPASGIGHLKNQADRAKAYRNYVEDAAANPNCVGTHWFTLYDESALGRFDGENYNIGFLDVCNQPYREMGAAAIASHERMYEVAAGSTPPYHANIEYLPLLFL